MSPYSPLLLTIETSGQAGELALSRGTDLLSKRALQQARKHARDLAPAVKELLESQSLRARDLQGILVSIGPGSYTGLRVGMMSAKTLAFACACPLVAVPTSAAVASQSPTEVERVDVLTDAQQERAYTQRYRREPEHRWVAEDELRIVPLREWLKERDPEVWFSGTGVKVAQPLLPENARIVEESARAPKVESVLAWGWSLFQKGDHADVHGLEPLYLRPSAAELQWEARHSS